MLLRVKAPWVSFTYHTDACCLAFSTHLVPRSRDSQIEDASNLETWRDYVNDAQRAKAPLAKLN
jgi:hypothetical protein